MRYSEYQQAIARTRYLFHDVDFYILSKDHINDFEPALAKHLVTDQYRDDIFPPRKTRKDFDHTQRDIALWLIKHGQPATKMEIHRGTGMSRATIDVHLKDMLEKNNVAKSGNKYQAVINVYNIDHSRKS